MRRLIEEDYLQQARAVPKGGASAVLACQDAAGACDGVKNGKYGFHTDRLPNPWWQVDLGRPVEIARVVVWNRLDYAPGLHNADNLRLLTSDDARTWTLRHDNQGRFFGGAGQGKPLEVTFEPPVRARLLRVAVPSDKPLWFHLDEVEVFGPDGKTNLALRRPADQSSISQWSTAKVPAPAAADDGIPAARTLEAIASARGLAEELHRAGADVAATLRELETIESRARALPAAAPPAVTHDLYLQARWAIRRLVLSNPLLDFDRLLLVKRFTQESYPDVCLNHMPWVSRPGGDVCVLARKTGTDSVLAGKSSPQPGGAKSTTPPDAEGARAKRCLPPFWNEGDGDLAITHVLNGALGPGHVHGMDLWYDGSRVVFGYARTRTDQPPAGWTSRPSNYRLRREEEPTHVFEVGLDGRRLRQLTSGQWSDLDPCYLPNGDVAFVSERCGFSLQCNEYDKDETSCNLYVMKGDGAGVRRLSVSKDGDYLPHVLDDGLIAYTRWEYHERSWAHIQSIWTIRPDGTGADALFKQHMNNPWALEDARSIPRSDKLVAVATGHHTLAAGPVCVIDPGRGLNAVEGIRIVTPGVRPPEGGMTGTPAAEGGVRDRGGFYQTPWALSERHFLVSYAYGGQTDRAGYALYLIDVYGNKELLYRDESISCFVPIPLRSRRRPPTLAENIDLKRSVATVAITNAAFGCDGVDASRARYVRVSETVGWPYDNTHGGWRYERDAKSAGVGWNPTRVLGTVKLEADGSAHFEVPADVGVYFQLLDENQMELRRMRSFISFQGGEHRSCNGCHETQARAFQQPAGLAGWKPPVRLTPPPWGDAAISFLRDVQPVLDARCTRCHSGLKPAGGLDLGGGLTAGYNRAYETLIGRKLVAVSPKMDDAKVTPPLAFGSHRSKLISVLRAKPHADRAKLTGDDFLRLVTWIDANAPYHDAFIDKRPAQTPYDLPADKDRFLWIASVHQRRCGSCHKADDVTRPDWIDLRSPERTLFLAAPLKADKCKGAYKDASDADYQAVLKSVQAAAAKAWAVPRRDLAALKSVKSANAPASALLPSTGM